ETKGATSGFETVPNPRGTLRNGLRPGSTVLLGRLLRRVLGLLRGPAVSSLRLGGGLRLRGPGGLTGPGGRGGLLGRLLGGGRGGPLALLLGGGRRRVALTAPGRAASAAAGRAGARDGRRRDDRRSAGIHLEDPEAQDAVRDSEVVAQLVEELAAGLEPEEPIVGLGALPDLVGELAHAPGGVVLEAAAGLDPRPGLRGDLLATVLRDLRIEHQHELVFPVRGCWQGGGRL